MKIPIFPIVEIGIIGIFREIGIIGICRILCHRSTIFGLVLQIPGTCKKGNLVKARRQEQLSCIGNSKSFYPE